MSGNRIQQIWLLVAVVMTTANAFAQQVQSATGLWTVDISHDDKYIAAGGDDSLLQVYNSDLRLNKKIKLHEHGMVRSVSWHPKELLLAISTRNKVWILDPFSGKEIHLEGLQDGSRSVAWNHDGQLLAAAAGRGIVWIWNREGRLLRKIQKLSPTGAIDSRDFMSIDWHPSKNQFATVGDDIRVFDTSGAQLSYFRHRVQAAGILTVKWHPSGEFFVTGDYGHPDQGIKNLLQFWRPDGQLIREWSESGKEYRNIRWNKDGSKLATGSDALRIWTKDGKLLHTSLPDGDSLWGVDWTSDSDRLVSVSFHSGKIRTWTAKARPYVKSKMDLPN